MTAITVQYEEVGKFAVGLDPELAISVCRATLPEHRSDGFMIFLNGEYLLHSVKPRDVTFVDCSFHTGERAVAIHGYSFPIDSNHEPEIKRLFNISNLSVA